MVCGFRFGWDTLGIWGLLWGLRKFDILSFWGSWVKARCWGG